MHKEPSTMNRRFDW